MSGWFASGRFLDWILAAVALEAAGLCAVYRAFGSGIPPARLLPTVGAGACVMLAMRLGLGGAWWGYVATALLGGLVFHVLDLAGRWR